MKKETVIQIIEEMKPKYKDEKRYKASIEIMASLMERVSSHTFKQDLDQMADLAVQGADILLRKLGE